MTYTKSSGVDPMSEEDTDDMADRRKRAAKFADRYIDEHRELFAKLEDE